MRILTAKNSGFCFGVRRAVETAERLSGTGKPVYTYGHIIHNRAVVEDLEARGVFPVSDPDALQAGDRLIIRAHGAPPSVFAACAERGISVEDATCPFVLRIHRIAEKAAEKGERVLIVGRRSHPEVIGILGWAGPGGTVLESAEDAGRLDPMETATVVAQTTLPEALFETVLTGIRGKVRIPHVFNTICSTTRKRQEETARIAEQCTKMIVLGSPESANTGKLRDIAASYCPDTIMTDCPAKVSLDNLHADDIIGIVAGASTPDLMIREVIQRMEEQEKTTVEIVEAVEETVAQQASPEPETAAEAVTETAVEEVTVAAEPASEEACPPETKEVPAEEAAKPAEKAEEEPSEFVKAFEKTMTRIHNGQVIEGTVLSIVDGEVFVNIGYKSDGIIPKNEFSSDPDLQPEQLFKPGDAIDVEVIKVNDGEGNVLLSRKNVENKKLWDELINQEDLSSKVFTATCKEVVKGGVIADMGGIRAFVPASHVSSKYVENLNDFVGKEMKLQVLEVDKQRKRIVASQKAVLLAEAAAAKRAKWEALEVGSKIHGIVRRITDFGAFVDIGGIDGLVHVTDAAWGRVKHPSDVFSIGQEIEVLVLNVDVEKERVSLGYKQLQPKPWTTAAERYPVGSIVEGKVVRIVPFGAFVALESTIDGLIHISQVAPHRIAKVEDELKVGDIVRCKVLEVNQEAKRISLSRKEAILEENPELAAQLEAERAERERAYAEKQEQRQQQREQAQQQRVTRSAAPRTPEQGAENAERRERSADRRRKSEDGEYELPPVQEATTSLAALFEGLKVED